MAQTLTCERCGKPIRPEDVEYVLSEEMEPVPVHRRCRKPWDTPLVIA
jgi:hypothetical protein